jgi:four helix bundle protein
VSLYRKGFGLWGRNGRKANSNGKWQNAKFKWFQICYWRLEILVYSYVRSEVHEMEAREVSERLLDYGVRAIRVVEALPRTLVGRRIGDQLLRSSISVGANYEEAQGAESREDFVHKLQIALKEIRESNYWLRLLAKADIIPVNRLSAILDESNQLRAMLSKAVATTKGKRKTASASSVSISQSQI